MEIGDVYFDNLILEMFQITKIENGTVWFIWLDDNLVQTESLSVLKMYELDGIIEKYRYD